MQVGACGVVLNSKPICAQTFEEEEFDGPKKGLYYPVNIGDVFVSKYQVLGKLGYGVSSTVWLARDLQ